MIEKVVFFFIGILVGVVCIFPYLSQKWKLLALQRQKLDHETKRLDEQTLASHALAKDLEALRVEIGASAVALTEDRKKLDARIISFKELEDENSILKRDLQNVDVNLHKLELDHELKRRKQEIIEAKCKSLGERYMNETVKSVVKSIGANNFSICKQRLLNVIGWCREIGFAVADSEEARLVAELRTEFEKSVKAALEAEEQWRIKAQIREEQKLQREIDAELKQLDREREAVRAALERAMADAQGKHTEEVRMLQERLAEAEEKSRRAVSRAQQTRAGFVYVISNVGSFGRGVFKIGMTRRLDPQERIDELGNASVPFPFDVHMQINCSDAPALENALHRELNKSRLNKANPRKEYFRTDLERIVEIIRAQHGEIEYVADPAALEYHQSMSMTDDDAKYIADTYQSAADKMGGESEDV